MSDTDTIYSTMLVYNQYANYLDPLVEEVVIPNMVRDLLNLAEEYNVMEEVREVLDAFNSEGKS